MLRWVVAWQVQHALVGVISGVGVDVPCPLVVGLKDRFLSCRLTSWSSMCIRTFWLTASISSPRLLDSQGSQGSVSNP